MPIPTKKSQTQVPKVDPSGETLEGVRLKLRQEISQLQRKIKRLEAVPKAKAPDSTAIILFAEIRSQVSNLVRWERFSTGPLGKTWKDILKRINDILEVK